MSKWRRNVATHTLAAVVGAAASYLGIETNLIYGDNDGDSTIISNNEDGKGRANTAKQTMVASKNINETIHRGNDRSPMSPISPITIFHPNPNLEIAYDARTKNPLYVLEKFQPKTWMILQQQQQQQRTHNKKSNAMITSSRDGKQFYEETSLPPQHRSRNGYYRNSGFDRGHLAPAADFSHDDKALNDTFSLCNISPQVPLLNRKVWSRLEALIRTFIMREAEYYDLMINDDDDHEQQLYEREVIVISGPLWLPNGIINQEVSHQNHKERYQYSHLGIGTPPSLIQVPTHFFKVIVSCSKSKSSGKRTLLTNGQSTDTIQYQIHKFAAFVVPNSDFQNKQSINLKDYLVRLTDLESVSGITFFPVLDNKTIENDTHLIDYQNNQGVGNIDDIDNNIITESRGSDMTITNHSSSIKQLLDLITEEIWIDCQKHSKSPSLSASSSSLTDDPQVFPSSSLIRPDDVIGITHHKVGKKKSLKVVKQLRKERHNSLSNHEYFYQNPLREDGDARSQLVVPEHFCMEGACDVAIKIK